jgi:hypothetical protein
VYLLGLKVSVEERGAAVVHERTSGVGVFFDAMGDECAFQAGISPDGVGMRTLGNFGSLILPATKIGDRETGAALA